MKTVRDLFGRPIGLNDIFSTLFGKKKDTPKKDPSWPSVKIKR